MKKLILIAALFAAIGAKAQMLTQPLFSGTNTVLAGLSNTTSTAVFVKSEHVELQWSFKLTGAGTSGLLFSVDTSADNSQWESGQQTFWRAGNGTTAVTGRTNLTITAPFMRVKVHNTNATIATNWTFIAVSKTGF